jgi:osmotically inducible lipoprotein OsmB
VEACAGYKFAGVFYAFGRFFALAGKAGPPGGAGGFKFLHPRADKLQGAASEPTFNPLKAHSNSVWHGACAKRASISHLIHKEDIIMKILKSLGVLVLAGSLGACAGMTTTERNTAIGAGAGALVGSVVTGGNPIGTVGGAAVGGVIGHEVSRRR